MALPLQVVSLVQRVMSRWGGASLCAGFGAYVVWGRRYVDPGLADYAALGLFVVSLALRCWRRYRCIPTKSILGFEIEILGHAVVGAHWWVQVSPSGWEGLTYPALYGLMMVAGSLCAPRGVAIVLLWALGLEWALLGFATQSASIVVLLGHAAWMGAFAGFNRILARGEVLRIRHSARRQVENEVTRMKAQARSYRLEAGSGPKTVVSESSLQAGVDEINRTLKFALELLRRALGLRTAVFLVYDPSNQTLTIQEFSTSEAAILPGPFGIKDGIIGAVLAQKGPLLLLAKRDELRLPYYAEGKPGSVCGIPIFEGNTPLGLLLVDRETAKRFSHREEQSFLDTVAFIRRTVATERVFLQMDRAKAEQARLYGVANALALATTEKDVISAGVNGAREFAAFDVTVVTLFDETKTEHEICAVSGASPERLIGQRFRQNQSLVSMVVKNRHALPLRGDYDRKRQVIFRRNLGLPDMASLLVLPLAVRDQVLGTLVLGSKRKGAFYGPVRQSLEMLASHMAVSLSNATMLRRLEGLASMDGLTGLLNKRTLTETAEQKLKSATRYAKPLAALICDIDHFKKVNDTYGHDVGDEVIRDLGKLLRQVKRDTDVVGRFGGEEFVVVCEQTSADGAFLLAERIRTELEALRFQTVQGELSVTCSVGIATFPEVGPDWSHVFKAADEALYESKRSGRNQVTLWRASLKGAA